ncbi:muscleblind-like protein 1 isoform X3 [Octopus sinensis]|uniref:Muscleblind-like protein 1 isoform X3 n=1 Tax=Octopus sinensis TaxID=2607531 RepID=A0A7E6FI54_9MOLL|nr:muscleblind-like protein 1 isoform X3 [Octopus sinensis]
MAMVNPMLNLANVKDSRWLTLEVCREFQRNKCTRSETECKFAHPPSHVEVQNGRVTACFDSIKGKCQRKDPPCKYLHPPQHLREQLLQNGRNNLIIKNLQLQAAQAAAAGLQPLVPGMIPTVASLNYGKMYEASGKAVAYPTVIPGQFPVLAPPYISTVPTSAVFNPYLNAAIPTVPVAGTGSEATVVSTQVPGVLPTGIPGTAQQKVTRADRLEVCREFQRCTCTRQPNDCRYAHPPENVTVDPSDNMVTVCMDYMKGKCTRDTCKYFHPPHHLQAQIKAVQQRANAVAVPTRALGGITGAPYAKRVAVADSKSGVPVYQPGNVAYQQALAMQLQQPYLPVTYSSTKLNEIQPYFTYSSTKLNEPYFTCVTSNLEYSAGLPHLTHVPPSHLPSWLIVQTDGCLQQPSSTQS